MTPLELEKRDFKKAVRGYSEEEVDFFLDNVRADYEAIYTENQDLKVRLEDYEQNIGKYKALENTLNSTLIVAQQTAEELKHNAEKAAELILEEAKLKAQQRIHAAEAAVEKLEMQREELLKRIQELKIRLRAFLRAQLDLLEDSGEEVDSLPQSSKFKKEMTKSPEVTKETPSENAQELAAEMPAAQLATEPEVNQHTQTEDLATEGENPEQQ